MRDPNTTVVTKAPVTIDVRVGQYLMVRERIEEAKARHAAELKPLTDLLLRLNGVLMDHMTANGIDSIKANGVGTAYKKLTRSATIADGGVFREFVIAGQHFDLIDWRANAPNVAAYIEANQLTPPGVNFRMVASVGVRVDSNPKDAGVTTQAAA